VASDAIKRQGIRTAVATITMAILAAIWLDVTSQIHHTPWVRMSFTPLSEDLAQGAVDAIKKHGSKRLAAAVLGIQRSTLRGRLKRAAEIGLMLDHPPAMPGFRVSQVTTAPDGSQTIQQRPEHGEVFETPAGMRLKGVTALVDSDGRVMHKHVMARENTERGRLTKPPDLRGSTRPARYPL
jgi:hypothetical protein